jgi:hypothetical protein
VTEMFKTRLSLRESIAAGDWPVSDPCNLHDPAVAVSETGNEIVEMSSATFMRSRRTDHAHEEEVCAK